MKKITSLKFIVLAFALLFIGVKASAQLLVENFDYTVGTVLTATATADPTSGWLAHSGNGTANVDVTTGLSFTGYAGSNVGGAANLDATGQDINRVFTPQTTGTVYAAFIIQTSASNSAGYFLHFSTSPVPTSNPTFWSKLYVNATGDGVAVSSSTAPTTWAPITVGVPTLLVLKYDIASKLTSLYVLSTFSATEPTTPSSSYTESTVGTVGSICLRQYAAAQRIIVDGIRVGTTWADACAAPASTPKVATPTFTAVPGNVISTQTVGIETATAGATIYYTIDGSDPTISSSVYSTPLSVSATTTVKAMAVKASYDNSSIATATYNFPVEVANLAALRAASQSGFYKVTGEVFATFASTAGKVKYIQDATAGIVVYDGSGKITTAYNAGDGIKNIYCTLSMFNGTLELIPFNDPGAANSTGNTITPKVIALTDLANNQGQLVKVLNVTIAETGNFAANTSYTLSDGTNTGKLRVAYTDLNYVGSAIPTTAQDIVGVVYNYSVSEVDLIPRSTADFAAALGTGVENPTLQASVYGANGNIVLTATAGQKVEIFNSVGQRLLNITAVEGVNTIPVNVKGLVIVKAGNSLSKIVL